MATKQTAVLVTQIGKPTVLTHDHPIPIPGPGQVQIKVSVAALNPHDQFSRDLGYFITDRLPLPLANDVVGTVSMLGSGVDGLAVGDRVLSHSSILGNDKERGTQQYALADVRFMMKIPDSVSDDQAVGLPTNLIAALAGIFSALGIPPPWTTAATGFDYANTTILIVGGGSNCGKLATQTAHLAGIGRIVVVGGDEQELLGYGATHVIDRHGGYETVLAKIRDVVQDSLVYAFDVINTGDGQLLALNALSGTTKGTMARLRGRIGADEAKVIDKNAGFSVQNVLGGSDLHPDLTVEFWKRLPGYLVTGKIAPLEMYDVKHGLNAENVNEALDRYRDGVASMQTHVHI